MPQGLSSTDPAAPPAAVGQQLLAEFIRYGHQRPFEEIVRRYAGMVFNVCYRVTKDKHDAEDATQAVFLTLAVQAKRGAEIKALGPWLQQVAKRLSLDVRRGQKRRKTREERHHDDQARRRSALDDDALPGADLEELKLILHEEMQKLPAKYRLPLILHYFGGLTRDEMAAELNCKPSTLGVRIFRAREMLAGRLNGRGVHLSAGAMAVAIGYLVRHTVTGAMVARTSYAAAALASGSADLSTVGQLLACHDGSAAAAARVIGLTRRASHVLVIGKVRVTVAVALLAGTSLGAGVKAFALLPPITMGNVRQMISAGVGRLIQPLVEPLSRPMRADATPVVVPMPAHRVIPVVSAPPPTAVPSVSAAVSPSVAPVAVTAAGVAVTPVAPAVAASTVVVPPQVERPAEPVATAAPVEHPAPAAVAAGDAAGAGIASHRSGDSTAAHAAPPLLASGGDPEANAGGETTLAGGGGMTASAANDLYVPPVGGASPIYYLGAGMSAASQVQILQVPAVGGSVSESNGVVRGYGRIAKTGTLSVSGKVVADGNGVDRTLDLTGFSAVQVATPTPASTAAVPATGWYAADHGRLSLALVRAPTTPTATVTSVVAGPVASAASTANVQINGVTVLTWGADPSAGQLTPVNSVRLTVHDGQSAGSLSLLSPDRSDAPAVPAADGAPIGLWEIDPTGTPLSAVDLLVRYDDHLVATLGGREAGVRLWTMGDDPSAGWQPVDDATFSLDTADHLVGGLATDVSYFAVTVPPAAGVDVAQMVAHSASQLAPAPAASTGGVPEPTAVAVLTMGAAGLLGRRRRCGVVGR